jgi:hypothetical protein
MRSLREDGDDQLEEFIHVADLSQLHQPVS